MIVIYKAYMEIVIQALKSIYGVSRNYQKLRVALILESHLSLLLRREREPPVSRLSLRPILYLIS